MTRRACSLSFCHIGGLKPFRALDYVERYPFALGALPLFDTSLNLFCYERIQHDVESVIV
jgi:hypothetical protein